MTTHMTADAQTQAMPHVPTTVVAVRDAEVPTPDPDPDPDPEDNEARTDWAQEMYEAGLAKLNTLHDHWAAAVAEIREAQASCEAGEAAA